MTFQKYQHVERFGRGEVEGIDIGECYIFPKIDGTCSSIWLDEGSPVVNAGSRNRQLSLEADNAGFLKWAIKQQNIMELLEDNPDWTIYGEWLVKHTLKTYREDAWRRFWVFDVMVDGKHLHYEEYALVLEEFKLDIITPMGIIKNPDEASLNRMMTQNVFLIEDGAGAGEGIVIKNYHYENKYGRQTWAKLVRNEFKEDNKKEFGINTMEGKRQIEAEIAEKFVTATFVNKTRAKIELETDERRKLIPRLLQTCYHDLIVEEIWNVLKFRKNATIDFGLLNRQVVFYVKKYASDLF